MIQEAQKICEREMPECKAIFEVADATSLTYESEQALRLIISGRERSM